MGSSLLSRKRDLAYFVHFVIGLPLMFRTSSLLSILTQLSFCLCEAKHCPEVDQLGEWTTLANHVIVIDLQALYPPSIVPSFAKDLKNYYINTYKDDFFVHTPPFFRLYMWSELLYQAPVMIWALGGLWNNSPRVPVVLLPFAVVIFLTTLTCMTEYAFWDVPLSQKIDLTSLYGPYLAISAFMAVDMYLRLSSLVTRQSAKMPSSTKKKQ